MVSPQPSEGRGYAGQEWSVAARHMLFAASPKVRSRCRARKEFAQINIGNEAHKNFINLFGNISVLVAFNISGCDLRNAQTSIALPGTTLAFSLKEWLCSIASYGFRRSRLDSGEGLNVGTESHEAHVFEDRPFCFIVRRKLRGTTFHSAAGSADLTGNVMGIVRLALRFPYTVYVLALLISFLGIVATASMPTDIFPEIDIPVVTVMWTYTGLSTPEMEQRVTT